MRERFHAELRQLDEEIEELAGLATSAMGEATAALAEADLARAESVLSSDTQLDALRTRVEEHASSLLALQAPVAGELRRIFAALLIASELERMGDLAVHVAEMVRRRHPAHVIRGSLGGALDDMGEHAHRLAVQMCQVLENDDVELARSMKQADDVLDDLKQTVQDALLYAPEMPGVSLADNVRRAVDGVLLARFFERYGDHAVSVARRVVFRSRGGEPDGDLFPLRSSMS